ncbi:MAG: winged helix-turn-helix domain-containing protein [Bacteriovoracaceae bacterium]|jgi:uncharacterized protein|nr:winged helix-turn-helix domain-containing protein [Bacteriovoracaceae bacterium]
MTYKLSLSQARSLLLQGQALGSVSSSPIDVLKQLGYVQIDTISVVERAHHHVFWSRFPKYKPSDLEQLVSSRQAFEYWAHAAAYLPMEDYRYTLHMKKRFAKRESSWWPRDPKLMKAVLSRIKNEGALQSKDFSAPSDTKNGWWQWKPAKKALERLFMEGKLEVTHRQGFHKVYDLAQRVIPDSVDKTMPTDSEFAQYLIRRTLRHHNFATPSEMAYLQRGHIKNLVKTEVNHLVENGELVRLAVEGIDQDYFASPQTLHHKPVRNRQVHILSPFDNLVIQRKKLLDFFDFDYQIECYVPAAKRKYGYFCLPILVGQNFVARIDCKADRKVGKLLVNTLSWESQEYKTKYKDRVMNKLKAFAKFNNCQI